MFGLSIEHLIIALVVLFIFGPRKIPELGGVLGKTVRNFKDHFKGIHEPEFKRLKDDV